MNTFSVVYIIILTLYLIHFIYQQKFYKRKDIYKKKTIYYFLSVAHSEFRSQLHRHNKWNAFYYWRLNVIHMHNMLRSCWEIPKPIREISYHEQVSSQNNIYMPKETYKVFFSLIRSKYIMSYSKQTFHRFTGFIHCLLYLQVLRNNITCAWCYGSTVVFPTLNECFKRQITTSLLDLLILRLL